MTQRLVVVGGGPAGLSAARAYREQGGPGEVLVLSADVAPPYDRPTLSKEYLRAPVTDAGSGRGLALEDEHFYRDQQIELRLGTEVTGLDPVGRRLEVGGEAVAFSTCVLATGSSARRPDGWAQAPGVLTLRSLADARRLAGAAATARRVAVVGSGFVGCEVAASLALRGLDVVLVVAGPRPHQQRLGDHAATAVGDWLRGYGVELVLGRRVTGLGPGPTTLRLDQAEIEADLVVAAAGGAPDARLAAAAGLGVRDGRVLVDAGMRTSAAGVFAAGDVALAVNGAAHRRLAVEHWGEALAMGSVAGANAAGADRSWSQAPGFWSTIGDHTLKQVAWGDGHDRADARTHPGGGWTVWYSLRGVVVGVLTYRADGDYERGRVLVETGAPLGTV